MYFNGHGYLSYFSILHAYEHIYGKVDQSVYKHQSFVYTQLNDQTVLFQTIPLQTKLNGSNYCYVSLTIQLNISHLFIYR